MSTAQATALQPNTPSPDFTLRDGGGKPRTLRAYRGTSVVLAFGLSDRSDVCSSQLAFFQETLADLRGDAELIAISVDGGDSHKAWVAHPGLLFPVLSDFWPHAAVAEQYGVLRPKEGFANRLLFSIDCEGTIRDAWHGEHPRVALGLNVVFDAVGALQEADDER